MSEPTSAAAEPREDLTRARLFVTTGSLAFAGMYTCVKLLSANVSSFEVLFARSTFGLVICLVLMRASSGTLRWGSLRLNFVRASFGFLSIASQFVALHEGRCSLSTVSFLRHAAPVWTLVLAGPLLQEWPDRRAKVAVAVGVAGTALALGPQHSATGWGLALAGAAGLFAALALLSVRKLSATESALSVVSFFMGFVALVTAPIVLAKWAREGLTWSTRDLCLVAGAALLGTLGQILNTSAYRHARAVSIGVAALAEVAFTLALAWTVAHDALPTWSAFAGGAAILTAAWLATSRRASARGPRA